MRTNNSGSVFCLVIVLIICFSCVCCTRQKVDIEIMDGREIEVPLVCDRNPYRLEIDVNYEIFGEGIRLTIPGTEINNIELKGKGLYRIEMDYYMKENRIVILPKNKFVHGAMRIKYEIGRL